MLFGVDGQRLFNHLQLNFTTRILFHPFIFQNLHLSRVFPFLFDFVKLPLLVGIVGDEVIVEIFQLVVIGQNLISF